MNWLELPASSRIAQTIERRLNIPLGMTTRSDATLRVTAAAETIVVTAETPSALETVTVGTNVTNEVVNQLPVVRTPTQNRPSKRESVAVGCRPGA